MINRSNFKKLALFLEQLDDDKFNMSYYISYFEDLVEYALEGKHPCDTVACAAGWGPAAGIPVDLRPGQTWVNWKQYIRENFLMPSAQPYEYDNVYHWVFSEHWTHYDNTPKGAAARIRWMLAGNPIDLPTSFRTVEKYVKG